MAKLIPEVHVNKLGVPVTKHVLPPSSASASNQNIPSPSAPSVQRDEWSEMKPLVHDHIMLCSDSSPNKITALIGALEPAVRRQVTDALLSGDAYSSYIALTVMEECKQTQVPYIMGTLSFHRTLHLEIHKDSMDAKYSSMIQRSSFSSLKSRFSFEFFGDPKGEVTKERLNHFKADIVDDIFDFRHAYPVNFERHAALRDLVENIDLIEAALPAMVQVKSGIRHWRQEYRQSTDAPSLLVPNLVSIAHVVNERPDSAGHFYRYARDRGSFDVEGFTMMIDTASPALYEGVL